MASCAWSFGMKSSLQRRVVEYRSRKVRRIFFPYDRRRASKLYEMALTIGITEFNDLWHSLKVPNDVDLLRQLASGTFLLFCSSCPSQLGWGRGPAGDECRSPRPQSPEYQEEGQAGRCPSTAPGADNQHAHEGRGRSLARLCPTWEVMVPAFEVLWDGTTIYVSWTTTSTLFFLFACKSPSGISINCYMASLLHDLFSCLYHASSATLIFI